MMDIIGLGTSEKDLILSFGLRGQTERFVREVAGSIDHIGRGRGIIMLVPLNAIGTLAATILQKQAGRFSMDASKEKTKRTSEASEGAQAAEQRDKGASLEAPGSGVKRSLILIAVNAGYTEEVMAVARKAGATGGTVIRGRLAGTEDLMQQFGINLSRERELLTILAAEDVLDDILQAVNGQYGLRSKAQGIVFAVPVEKAFKI